MTVCILDSAAARHIDDIRAFIARDDALAAERVVVRIHLIVDLLAVHPLIGRKTLERGVRTLVVKPYPYIVFYRYSKQLDLVRIIRVRHGAMRRPGLADDASEFRAAANS